MASLTGNDAFNCSLSSLDFFSPAIVQEDVEEGYWEPIASSNTLDNRDIQFHIDAADKLFIDPQHSYVKMRLKIQNNDDTALADDAEVSVINYIAATMWKQIDLYLANNIIQSSNDYHYQANMEVGLSYNANAKNTWLQSSLYYEDTARKFNELNNTNLGYQKRKNHFAKSRGVELISRLHLGFFNQQKLLLDNVPMKLVFQRNRDDMCLLTANDTNVKIEIEDMMVVVRRVKLADHVYNSINAYLSKNDAIYPITRSTIKTFTKPAGVRDISINNQLSTPDIPTRIIIGMVSNAAYSGAKALNPFEFKHFNINYADVRVNAKSVLTRPLRMDMASRQYLDVYNALMITLGLVGRDDGYNISRDQFDGGYFLLGVDLTPTLCNGAYADPIQSGNVDIELKFAQQLPETVTIIVYCQYSNKIIINKAHQVTTNF